MGTWDNAFKLPSPPEVTAAEKTLLDALAGRVRGRGLGETAALVIESTRPLHYLGAQGITFLGPVLDMLFKPGEAATYATLLENPKAVSYLADRLVTDGAENNNSQGEPDVKTRP